MMEQNAQTELERLRAENARLKQGPERELSFKVSVKGALSVYGLGRFPVTLYKEQWHRLLGRVDDLRAFLAAHDAELKSRDA